MIYPCIQVCDIETTISWYSDFLDFECTFKSGLKNPEFAVLEKDDMKIYIRQDLEQQSYASNIIVIETTDIKAKYKEIEQKGLIIIQQISKGIFGSTDFIVKDYEDNKIIFKQIE